MDRLLTVGPMATFQALRSLMGVPTRDHRTAPMTLTDGVLPSESGDESEHPGTGAQTLTSF